MCWKQLQGHYVLLRLVITATYENVISSPFYRLELWVTENLSNFLKDIPLESNWASTLTKEIWLQNLCSFLSLPPLFIPARISWGCLSKAISKFKCHIRILEPKSKSLGMWLFSQLIIVIRDWKQMNTSMSRDVQVNYVLLQDWRDAKDILLTYSLPLLNC